MTQYEKSKASILKWRENNIEEFRKYQREYKKRNYNDIAREQKRQYYLKKKYPHLVQP